MEAKGHVSRIDADGGGMILGGSAQDGPYLTVTRYGLQGTDLGYSFEH
jgi:hypothetical protein